MSINKCPFMNVMIMNLASSDRQNHYTSFLIHKTPPSWWFICYLLKLRVRGEWLLIWLLFSKGGQHDRTGLPWYLDGDICVAERRIAVRRRITSRRRNIFNGLLNQSQASSQRWELPYCIVWERNKKNATFESQTTFHCQKGRVGIAKYGVYSCQIIRLLYC